MQLVHCRAGRGEPLVLIHGIGSRWQVWTPVLDALSARHDVIALDLPGFGASPMPAPGTPAGVDSLVSLVLSFLADIGVDRPHVAGNSLGGLMALELARRDAVRSVAALSPAGFATHPEMVVARSSLWLAVRAARGLSPHADSLMRRSRFRQLALMEFFARPAAVSPADAAADLRALAGAPWFDETLREIRSHPFRRGDPIGVPVTIAWGEKDRLLLPGQALRAARAIPGSKLTILHGCGHVPMSDDPEQVLRVLLEAAAGA